MVGVKGGLEKSKERAISDELKRKHKMGNGYESFPELRIQNKIAFSDQKQNANIN